MHLESKFRLLNIRMRALQPYVIVQRSSQVLRYLSNGSSWIVTISSRKATFTFSIVFRQCFNTSTLETSDSISIPQLLRKRSQEVYFPLTFWQCQVQRRLVETKLPRPESLPYNLEWVPKISWSQWSDVNVTEASLSSSKKKEPVTLFGRNDIPYSHFIAM